MTKKTTPPILDPGLGEKLEHRSPISDTIARAWKLVQSAPLQALELADDALKRAYTDHQEGAAAEARLTCGWAQIFLGDYEAAIPHLIECLDSFRSHANDDGQMRTVNAIGTLLFRIGEYEQAAEEFVRVLEWARRSGNKQREIAALNNLGEIHIAGGEIQLAESSFSQALSLATTLAADLPVVGIVRANLGRVFTDLGRIETARHQLELALEVCVSSEDRVTEAEVLTNLGRLLETERSLHDTTNSNEDAYDLHLQALALNEEINYPAGTAMVLENLIRLSTERGLYDEAIIHLRLLVESAERTSTRLPSMDIFEQLVAGFVADGRSTDALDLSRWALEFYRNSSQSEVSRRIRTARERHDLERANMQAEIERRIRTEVAQTNQKLELMHAIGPELTATLDLEKVAKRLHDRVNEMMQADVFGIALLSGDGGSLEYDFFIEHDQRLTPVSVDVENRDSFGSWVVRERQPVILLDADREYHKYVKSRVSITSHRSGTIVYLPLELEGEILGVLTVQADVRDAYDKDAIDTLQLLTPYVAIAVANSRRVGTIRQLNRELTEDKRSLERAYERIAHMANHDTLTQLPNRRLLAELLNDYIPHARRHSRQFGLLYLDLDDFKPVNDTFGHEAGDFVLAEIAARLRTVVRQSDIVARIGGDEFVLVVRDALGLGDVIGVAEKVIQTIKEPIAIAKGVCSLSASVGVSVFPDHGISYEGLVRAADRAMYRAKQAGKAGVSVATSEGYESAESLDSTLDQSMPSSSKTNQPSTERS